MSKAFWAFLFFSLAILTFAQEKTHQVEAKETIYGISKKYNVSQEALKKANPFLAERSLQIGDTLVIPGKSDGSIKPVVTEVNNQTSTDPGDTTEVIIPKEDENFIYYKVAPKQTLYSLTREFKISEDALKSLNPQLEQGLKAGDIIRIPKKKSTNGQEEIVPEGMHKVSRGETVFSLTKQFGVSEDEFYIANPSVQTEGLIVDSYIKIPKKGSTNAVIQDGFIEHKVKAGETIYSITKLYKVSFADLMKHNPELSEGLKTGMTLKIPLQEGANIIKAPGKIKRIDDNEINIALILPFHLENATGKEQEKTISTDILIGGKMALDSLARKGKQIHLKVLDSENQAGSLESMLASTDFSKFDVIVGPLFGSNFKSMATMLSGSGIALVSPLSNSDDLKELENVIIATPSDEAIADAIIDEIKSNYKGQQIQILTDDRHENLANYVSSNLNKKISGADIFITKDANKLFQKSETVDEKLTDGTIVKKEYFTPIITVLVSDNNSLGATYVNKIKTMDAENLQAYGVKFVSAYDIYNDKNKENIAALKNIGFAFSTVRLVNVYGASERNTLEKFLDIYCLTPNEYQQVGFDVFYDLVDRMNSRGDVLNSLNSEQTRLATKFKYEKEGKAYVNKSVRVVRLFVKADESPDDVDGIKD
ncbi:LysM peptidoglycan-binding domain-containing protein [Moheibacter lacus]|uniref:LysM peptidoglycan-binding domain-containing protein n=1 Tax=Moheibacter lacus TaxID=2745851 RepID=A0A838ZI25_9FLAO|nr:LysM peptidoglycan-binding domain-containing protein [Moheibacter lacus]MBA5628898.1 LysM peptidoglycan-binding domain-containing protein [Moheibacter lacus]